MRRMESVMETNTDAALLGAVTELEQSYENKEKPTVRRV